MLLITDEQTSWAGEHFIPYTWDMTTEKFGWMSLDADRKFVYPMCEIGFPPTHSYTTFREEMAYPAHGLGATRLCWWNLAGVPFLYCYQCLVPWDQATKLDLNEEATDRTNSGLVPRMATKVFHTLGCAETRLQIGPHLN